MSEMRASHPEELSDSGSLPGRLTSAASILMLLSALVGLVALGLLTRPLDGAVPLTVLVALAMLGAFFMLGVATGHVSIGESSARHVALDAVVRSLGAGVLVTDGNGDRLFANNDLADSVARILSGEVGAAGAQGRTAQASQALFRLIRQAERGNAASDHISVPRASGARSLRISARPWSSGPRTTGAILVLWHIEDVTEDRDRQAERLSILQSALRRYDDGPIGLVTVARDGSLVHVNRAFAQFIGSTPHRALLERDLKLDDFLSRDDLELVFSRARDETGGAGVDVDLFREDGGVVAVRLTARRAEDGFVLAVAQRDDDAAGDRDETSAEVRFARFFRSAPFGIATVGPDGRLLTANAAFSRMMLDGRSGAGETAANVLSADADAETRESIQNGLTHVLAGKGKLSPIDILIDGADQTARRVYMSPVSGSRRAREAAVIYSMDSTEQKALEAKLAQSQKMDAVGKLAGGIAHDFNNVLTVIIGYSDILLQNHKPADPAYQEIRYIKSSAERAAGLVGKLLTFSRQQAVKAEILQLEDMLADLSSSLLRRSLGEKIALSVSHGRDVWPIKADKIQLEQVFLNLVVNARDAMPSGGAIKLNIRNVSERESQRLNRTELATGEYVLVEVADTGSGMPPETLAKIFEPFFTTKGVGKGTGLGLSTAYGSIKQMGGYIYADSVVGEGTTFRIYLPRHLAEPDAEAPGIAASAPKKEPEKRADITGTGRVLLVEDEDMVRGFAVRALKSRGYEVFEASTGVEALEVMERRKGQIDIVVSDVVMPEMDGPTLLKELRKSRPDLRIVFVSGYPNEAFKASLDEHEQFAFLAKPFSLPQLAAKVKEELSR